MIKLNDIITYFIHSNETQKLNDINQAIEDIKTGTAVGKCIIEMN